ncbi:MAG: Calx-beta domain-containing protein [Thermoanaerobaculia bacterium]
MIRSTCAIFAVLVATGAFAQSTIGFTYYGSAVQENAGTVQLTVIRTGSLTGAAAVDYTTMGDPGGRYVAVSGKVQFGNGESEKTISIDVIDDNVTDPERSFTFAILLSNWVNSSPNQYYEYSLEIKDNEPPPPPLTLSYGNLTFSEGDGVTNAYLTVSLNHPNDNLVWFSFRPIGTSTYNGTGVSLGDARFEPGETTKQVPVTIHGNNTYETMTKTFHYMPISAMWDPVVALEFDIILTEDDSQGTISISDISVPEGSCGPTPIEITLTADAPVTGTVQWTTSDGTGTEADIDYGPYGVHEPVHMVNATTAKITVVAPYGDLKIEGDETFFVTLTSATDMNIGDGTATVTIENDDEELPSFVEDLVRIEAGTQSNLTINFPAPAPAGSVLLSSSDPRVKVPASVDVPERATSVTFTADATDAAGRVVVTAALGNRLGATRLSATIDAFRDSDLRFQGPRRAAFAGETMQASIALEPARDQEVTVMLTATAGIVAPESVVVPPGGTGTFLFTSLAAGPGRITATYGENVQSLELDVAAQELKSFAPDFAPTIGGIPVTLKGLGFSDACRASFGDTAAETTFVDTQTLIAKAPAHAAEAVNVTVTCGVTPATIATQFRFANARRRASRH